MRLGTRVDNATLWIVLGLGLAAFALAGIGYSFFSDGTSVRAGAGNSAELPPLPKPVSQIIKPLSREEAIAANAAVLFSKEPIEPARAFSISTELQAALTRKAAVDCLTAAIYYEAAGESDQGQRAVAQVVLNRVRHPAFPRSICEVVYQGSERLTGCQFSFTCDGSLQRKPIRSGWDRAARIAESAISGAVEPSVGMATHYHANWVVPYWASELDKVAAIGAHIFYRWRGYWGKRQAFAQAYAGELTLELAELAPAEGLESGMSPQGDFPTSEEGLLDRLLIRPLPAEDRQRSFQQATGSTEPVADELATNLLVDQQDFNLAIDGEEAD